MRSSIKFMSDITVYGKYAKYIPELKRREMWEEIVLRSAAMHSRKFPELEKEIYSNFTAVLDEDVLPSMRTLQFAGTALEINNARNFNCSYCPIDNIDVFSETMFLLLSGCGFSYSVQSHHIEKLPELRGPLKKTRTYLINDSIIGWADAIKTLIRAYFLGKSTPVFDYRDIRPKGSMLITSGGKAPGPQPLKDCIHNIMKVLDNALDTRGVGTQLKSIEAHDIQCFIADAVLSGGIRRAACLVGFSFDDEEMLNCKSPEELELNPQRHRANNSVVLLKRKLDKQSFDSIFDRIEKSYSGEPGIIISNDKDMLFNPCFTHDTLIGVADGRGAVSIGDLAKEGKDVPVYSVDKNTGMVSIKLGRNPRLTGEDRDIVKITLDDDTFIKVTPNHKMLLRTCEEIEAKDLKVGDSLARFNKRLENIYKDGNKYIRVNGNILDSKKNNIFEHRLISKFYNPDKWNDIYNNEKNNGWIKGGIVIHHKDYNSLNNSPDNLEIMTFKDHSKLHSSIDTIGQKNGRYSGFTNEQIKNIAINLVKKLGRRFSSNEWDKMSGCIKTFSPWRQTNFFKSSAELSLWAAIECGFENQDLDVRVLKTYSNALEQGYDTIIKDNSVYIKKQCEECQKTFIINYKRREQSYCSNSCSSKKNDMSILHKANISKQETTRTAQINIYNNLKLNLNRIPLKKEWELECDKNKISHRIGSKNQNAYKNNPYAFFSFNELKEYALEFNHKVKKIEFLVEKENVYNITVDDNHTIGIVTKFNNKTGELSGIFTPQCGEAALRPNSFCNLTTINMSTIKDQEDFNNRARIAAFIGTIQASYTDFHYLRDIWKTNTEKDSLIGVSMTGMASEKIMELDFKQAAEIVVKENERVAKLININPAARTTLLKPEGTTSTKLGCSSGIHGWHDANYYIRRIRLNKDELLFKYLFAKAPELFEDEKYKPKTISVLSIPVKVPEGAITREEPALDLLSRCVKINKEWIKPGHKDGANSHNVSCTVTVKNDEWSNVRSFVWEHKDNINGMTFFRYDGNVYDQPPFESCSEDIFNKLNNILKNAEIDLSEIIEESDDTDLKEQAACAGNVCEITHV